MDLALPTSTCRRLDSLGQIVPMIAPYDTRVFHMQQYVPQGVDGRVEIVPPAIDPLSPKNMALSPEDAAYVCDQFGIDVDRPLMCQVSRFDPWKDPNGVIDCYREVREQIEDLSCAGWIDEEFDHPAPGPALLNTPVPVIRKHIQLDAEVGRSASARRSSRRPTSYCRSRSARASA